MSKSNDLRKLIQSRLLTLKSAYPLKGVFYRVADEKTMYPHIVTNFNHVLYTGMDRDDVWLDVDIYDTDQKRIEDIADDVQDLFSFQNLPQATILPTLFIEQRNNVPDEDESIKHILLRFTVQNYERK